MEVIYENLRAFRHYVNLLFEELSFGFNLKLRESNAIPQIKGGEKRMLYKLVQAFDGTVRNSQPVYIEDRHQRNSFNFPVKDKVDRNYPVIVIIKTKGVQYHKNRVALNENFIGHLTSAKDCQKFETSIFVVDNPKFGYLVKGNNKVTVLGCDIWGDKKSVAELDRSSTNIDNFTINNIDICYVVCKEPCKEPCKDDALEDTSEV